jgi:hypothetical protein
MANHDEMNGKVGNKRLIIKEEIKHKIHILNAQSASPVKICVTKKIKAAVVMTSASYSEALPSNISMYASCYDQLFFCAPKSRRKNARIGVHLKLAKRTILWSLPIHQALSSNSVQYNLCRCCRTFK